MSLDIYIIDPEKKEDDDYFSWNYTYNVSNMWYEVFPLSDGMIDIDDQICEHSLPKLEFFYKELSTNPDKFKAMNPTNGWGSYATFLAAIEKLIKAAKEYPNCVWRVSR